MTTTVTVRHVEGGHDFSEQVVCTGAALDAVLFDFNPSANGDVTIIKALHAALITKMQAIVEKEGRSPKARCASIAITELEGTQMRAVKALFAK